ncbi:hypothetical protein LINPERPRIM_LOCUS1878 [Linum perenne]
MKGFSVVVVGLHIVVIAAVMIDHGCSAVRDFSATEKSLFPESTGSPIPGPSSSDPEKMLWFPDHFSYCCFIIIGDCCQ